VRLQNPDSFGTNNKSRCLAEVESDQIMDVARKMATFENVTYVACGIGQNDISIQLVAKRHGGNLLFRNGSSSQSAGGTQDDHLHRADRSQRCVPVAGPERVVKEINSVEINSVAD